jgi:hypothetical protein
MPNLEYFLVAESISVDRSTNRISLFNVLEEIPCVMLTPESASRLQPGILQLAVVSAWNMNPDDSGREFRVELRVHIPNNPEAIVLGPPLSFTATQRRHRAIQTVVGFPIPSLGDVRFEVLLNGERQASHTMTCFLAQSTVPQPLPLATPPPRTEGG